LRNISYGEKTKFNTKNLKLSIQLVCKTEWGSCALILAGNEKFWNVQIALQRGEK